MTPTLHEQISSQLADLQQEGLFKAERVISSPQHAAVKMEEEKELLNFCANNYLGLSNHPELLASTQKHWKHMALACLRCDSFAGLKPFTNNLKHA